MPQIIRVEEGDISSFRGDAIVNAANNHLKLGAGVAGAIAARGGPAIQAECDAYVAEHGPLRVGEAALTGGGDLDTPWVIHAAAMGDEPATEQSIRSATRSAMQLARERHLDRIALPVLGSGVAGFPFEDAARYMIEEVRAFLEDGECPTVVTFYGYAPEQAESLRAVLG